MIALERSKWVSAAVVPLVTLVALALLGLVLAHWTWVWFAPRPESRAPAAAEQEVRLAAAFGLFGNAPATASSSTGAINLLGVVASTGDKQGYAVMQLPSREVLAVREGEDLSPGVQLAEVHRDHVILSRNGVRETLEWPEKKK